jgi:hypothetical protein
VLAVVIQRIVIVPATRGSRWDADRVAVEWRA